MKKLVKTLSKKKDTIKRPKSTRVNLPNSWSGSQD